MVQAAVITVVTTRWATGTSICDCHLLVAGPGGKAYPTFHVITAVAFL